MHARKRDRERENDKTISTFHARFITVTLVVRIVHIVSRRAKLSSSTGRIPSSPLTPSSFQSPGKRGIGVQRERYIRPRCRRNRFTTVRYQDVRIVHGWAWISRVHNEVERRSRGGRKRCRNRSKEGGGGEVGERRKVKERGEGR